MSLPDAKNSKEKCSAAFVSDTILVRFSVCNKGFHHKCSTGPKALNRDDQGNMIRAPGFSKIE